MHARSGVLRPLEVTHTGGGKCFDLSNYRYGLVCGMVWWTACYSLSWYGCSQIRTHLGLGDKLTLV